MLKLDNSIAISISTLPLVHAACHALNIVEHGYTTIENHLLRWPLNAHLNQANPSRFWVVEPVLICIQIVSIISVSPIVYNFSEKLKSLKEVRNKEGEKSHWVWLCSDQRPFELKNTGGKQKGRPRNIKPLY